MGKHTYNPQSAADAVVEQAERINNLIPVLNTGRSSLAPNADEVETARAIHAHAAELRIALSALESMAEAITFKAEKRKEVLLDGFLE